ncbi:MAG: ATP phosphoribosyltransferase [Gammaproteobacteria bacterium]|nr:ATP phosphoribosyltransferase [Gammaproteobacteria bacterium]
MITQKKQRLRVAIQKKGRLNRDSIDLLTRCGLQIALAKSSLFCHVENLPIDILFVRDDDIPTLVMDNLCDIGIVGDNVLQEKNLYQRSNGDPSRFEVVKRLGFSRCRLSIAFPQDKPYQDCQSLAGLRIATSYPHLLNDYLQKNQLQAETLVISGSVEVAPRLEMADAICDLVSTGRTLEENNLREVETVIESEAVLIKSTSEFSAAQRSSYELLLRRIKGVLRAKESKYIMLHAPKSALPAIAELLPGFEAPTIMPLEGDSERVAVHVVSAEGSFWVTLEKLKACGASSILVLPIEKMLY